MQWLFAIRPVSQVLTVESILGKLRPPEIELSVLNQSGLAAKEFMDGGGTGVEFALDSPFIELPAAEPLGMPRNSMDELEACYYIGGVFGVAGNGLRFRWTSWKLVLHGVVLWRS